MGVQITKRRSRGQGELHKCVQGTTWRPRGQGESHKRLYRAQLGAQEARESCTNGCTEPNLAPKRLQVEPERRPRCPSWAQEAPKRLQVGPKRRPRRPSWAQEAPKRLQVGPKRRPRGSKFSPRGVQEVQLEAKNVRNCTPRPLGLQKGPNLKF